MMQPKIVIPEDKIAAFCQKHFISSMSLFGSVLGEKFKPSSDVDFLVEFQAKHTPTLFEIVKMEEELSQIVGHHADLRTPEDLSHYFRNEVIDHAHVIYG